MKKVITVLLISLLLISACSRVRDFDRPLNRPNQQERPTPNAPSLPSTPTTPAVPSSPLPTEPQTSVGFIPLTDLGAGTYQGYEGGLYPNGQNIPPPDYLGRIPLILVCRIYSEYPLAAHKYIEDMARYCP